MTLTSSFELKNGQTLVTINGYAGETDFYAMYDVIKEKIGPDGIRYGVDSMCVDGSFEKGNIRIRMSSESAYDYMCLMYDKSEYTPEENETISGWTEMLANTMRAVHEPVEAEDDW